MLSGLRHDTIGGSDAAAIVGLSRYGSQYSVFMDKTGRLPDKPDNEAMRQGRDLEEYVSQRFEEETGKKVRRLQAKKRVCCEGGCVQSFPDVETAKEFMERLCASKDRNWESCSLASALLRYYERKENERDEQSTEKQN